MRTVTLSSIVIALSAGTAYSQQACSTYTVQRGDTLYNISRAAFDGDHQYHDEIYRLNRSVIGRNPNYLETGIQLEIYCPPGGQAPAQTATGTDTQAQETTTAVAEPVVQETVEQPEVQETVTQEPVQEPVAVVEETVVATEEQSGPSQAAVDRAASRNVALIVTANGFPPYTDESLPNRGMLVEMVETALVRGNPDGAYAVSFVNDRESHRDLLLPSMSIDASFPWSMPDCGMDEQVMTDFEIFACSNFVFTDPFYTIVDGFYAVKGSEHLDSFDYADLVGTTICRPEGYTITHLEVEGLVPPAVEYVTPVTAEECFEMLMFGEVDLVSMDLSAGDHYLNRLNISFDVASNPNIVALRPLNVVLMKSNPNAEGIVEVLNDGLAEMQQSGEWFDIGSRGLQYQMEAASMN